jgi:BirA family biotin operon repressor/biotin-[acetyl-CoA-carboxylase] ligase
MTDIVRIEQCQSTQAEVRARLSVAAAKATVAVRADRQLAGRGRDGRRWQDPPGAGLLLSVGARGPLQLRVLEDLPQRIADVLLELLADAGADARWKAPNDLVSSDGAKLAGILVDARTTGEAVDQVIVGIGMNLTGAAFTTSDGRAATTVEQLGGTVDAASLAASITDRLSAMLD